MKKNKELTTNELTVENQITTVDFFNPTQFESVQRVAKMFANSELVPDMYKVSEDNPPEKAIANCVIAIDIAQRIRANVLMVMQNLIIIYGRPSWSSKFLIATINTCGRFEPLKFEFTNLGKIKNVPYTAYEWKNGKRIAVQKQFKETIDNLQCVAYTSPKGKPDEVLESSPITIELAIKEGWYTKNGSKWKTMTRQMLMYRAASFWTSTYAPELSMGMRTEDELKDMVEVDYREVPTDEEAVQEEIKQNANKETIDIQTQTDDDDTTGLTEEEKAEIERMEKEQAEQERQPEF